jgi:hypothetical protein
VSNSPSLLLTIPNSRGQQIITLNDAFQPVINKKGQLTGFRLQPCNSVIPVEAYEPLKLLIAQLAQEALETALELLINDPDRSRSFNKDFVYFEYGCTQIFSYVPDYALPGSFSAEIELSMECMIDDMMPVFMYTADGCVHANYRIGPGNEVLERKIGFIT